MISVKLTFDDAFLADVLKTVQDAQTNMAAVVGRSILPDVRGKALQALRDEPGSVVYPIEWKSLRQRRAYFATDGFGHGIPYRRTGALLNAWDVSFYDRDDGGNIVAENDNPAARFVIGTDQQPFHRNTGWYFVDDKIPPLTEYANGVLISAWQSVASFD